MRLWVSMYRTFPAAVSRTGSRWTLDRQRVWTASKRLASGEMDTIGREYSCSSSVKQSTYSETDRQTSRKRHEDKQDDWKRHRESAKARVVWTSKSVLEQVFDVSASFLVLGNYVLVWARSWGASLHFLETTLKQALFCLEQAVSLNIVQLSWVLVLWNWPLPIKTGNSEVRSAIILKVLKIYLSRMLLMSCVQLFLIITH